MRIRVYSRLGALPHVAAGRTFGIIGLEGSNRPETALRNTHRSTGRRGGGLRGRIKAGPRLIAAGGPMGSERGWGYLGPR